MLNYIKQELYRISHKKSMYLYYGGLMLGFVAIMLLGSLGDASSFLDLIASFLVSLSSIVIIVQVFATVYGDDVSSRSLGLSISTGISRTQIIIGKLVVSLLLLIVIFTVFGLFATGFYLILGGNFNSADMVMIRIILVKVSVCILVMVAFMNITAAVLYQTQNSTVGSVMVALFMMQFVYMIISLLAQGIPFMSQLPNYSITTIQTNLNSTYVLNQTIDFGQLGLLCAYIIGGTALTSFVLSNKEINN